MPDQRAARPPRGPSEDAGFAMVVSVVIATVALLLVTLILTSSVHLDTATTRERRWQSALQVAESGVEDAVTKLRSDLAYAGTTAPVGVAGGQFEVKVTNLGGASRQVDAVGYIPSKTAANALKRRIRVVYEPEPSFKYALFSSSSLFVKSGTGVIDGDVFGNEDVTIDNTSEVIGNVISAWGKVDVSNFAKITKDPATGEGGNVYSGGFNPAAAAADRWAVNLNNNNSRIEGDVHIRVETVCNTSPGGTLAYRLRNLGTVGGTVHMPAAATVANPVTREDKCVQRPAKTPLPKFTFDPTNYPGMVEWTTTQFNAGGAITAPAVYVKSDGTGPIDLGKRYTTGDLVLISEPKIRQSNTGYQFFPTSLPRTSIIQIISLDPSTNPSNPSFEVENKFNVMPDYSVDPSAPAVLVYSPGYCDFKNATLTNGSVYCNGMNIKNSLETSYDGRLERILGFGKAKLVRSSFVELPASTPL